MRIDDDLFATAGVEVLVAFRRPVNIDYHPPIFSLSIAKRRDLRHGPRLSEPRGIYSESGRQRLGPGRIVRLGTSPRIEADRAQVHGPDSRSRRASDHARIPSQAARAGADFAAVDFAVTHFFASPSALSAKHRRRLAVQRVGNSGPALPVKWGSSRP